MRVGKGVGLEENLGGSFCLFLSVSVSTIFILMSNIHGTAGNTVTSSTDRTANFQSNLSPSLEWLANLDSAGNRQKCRAKLSQLYADLNLSFNNKNCSGVRELKEKVKSEILSWVSLLSDPEIEVAARININEETDALLKETFCTCEHNNNYNKAVCDYKRVKTELLRIVWRAYRQLCQRLFKSK